MSAIEETKTQVRVPKAHASDASPSVITRALNLLSSVRFGVTLLVMLAVASMIGMLIVQQNVEGFDKYFANLTPAQKFLYGKLGFFDIYHSWYFDLILLILSLNIVLASIDRFPSAWTYIKKKKLDASAHWLRGQEQSASVRLEAASRDEAVGKIKGAFRTSRMKAKVSEKNGKTFVFGERGTWNRLGAYAVHVALLTIFFGAFLTSQFGRTGSMGVEPGVAPQDIAIPRNGVAKLTDGTRVEFRDFSANFTVGGNNAEAGEGVYMNPAATLAVTPPGATTQKAFAFTPEMAERAPFAKQPVAGYTWRLVDFEKAPKAHILSIQKDPGSSIVYVGFTMLGMTLFGVFFFSHVRVWALVEEKGEGAFDVVLGGNTDRNHLGFGDRFRKLVGNIGGEPLEVKAVEKLLRGKRDERSIEAAGGVRLP